MRLPEEDIEAPDDIVLSEEYLKLKQEGIDGDFKDLDIRWFTGTKTPVVVINLHTDDTVDMKRVLQKLVFMMHDLVMVNKRKYDLVWLQKGDHRIGLRFLLQDIFKSYLNLPDLYTELLVGFHIVHPSWASRLFQVSLFPWNFLSTECKDTQLIGPWVNFWNRFKIINITNEIWEKLHVHERVEFLADVIDLKQLPKELIDYDKILDNASNRMIQESEHTLKTNGFHVPSSRSAYDPSDDHAESPYIY